MSAKREKRLRSMEARIGKAEDRADELAGRVARLEKARLECGTVRSEEKERGTAEELRRDLRQRTWFAVVAAALAAVAVIAMIVTVRAAPGEAAAYPETALVRVLSDGGGTGREGPGA